MNTKTKTNQTNRNTSDTLNELRAIDIEKLSADDFGRWLDMVNAESDHIDALESELVLKNGCYILARAHSVTEKEYVLAFDGDRKFATWHIYTDENGTEVTTWGHYFDAWSKNHDLEEYFEKAFENLLERSDNAPVSYADAYRRFKLLRK